MKALKIIVIVLLSLVAAAFIAFNVLKSQTKKHSPEVHISKTVSGAEIGLFYSSPFKKDRVIFGGLVPYNAVWRTGANEATTFSTSKDLMVEGKLLKAGEYSLWTIPTEGAWTFILNSEIPDWGANFDQTAKHDPTYDVLRVDVAPEIATDSQESLEISINEEPTSLCIAWDLVRVNIEFEVK
jgi:hypothetical protein